MINNILLTGSGGFIGKNLKQYLKDKFNLFTPRSFELNLLDKVAVKNYFEENNIELIIHCGSVGGARGISDKDTTIEDNLLMVNNLIEAKTKNDRIILFGSGAMYDKSRNLHKVKESEIGKVKPYDLYGQSKVEIAKKTLSRDDILCLNIFACYGYGEKENRFPTYAISQNLKKEPIVINQNVVFDYLFIEDMQKIIHHFILNKTKNKIINITPKESINLEEIAQIINEISDYKSEIIIKNPVLNNEYTGDNTLLTDEYPNIRFTSYKDGLKKLYEFIKTEKNPQQ